MTPKSKNNKLKTARGNTSNRFPVTMNLFPMKFSSDPYWTYKVVISPRIDAPADVERIVDRLLESLGINPYSFYRGKLFVRENLPETVQTMKYRDQVYEIQFNDEQSVDFTRDPNAANILVKGLLNNSMDLIGRNHFPYQVHPILKQKEFPLQSLQARQGFTTAVQHGASQKSFSLKNRSFGSEEDFLEIDVTTKLFRTDTLWDYIKNWQPRNKRSRGRGHSRGKKASQKGQRSQKKQSRRRRQKGIESELQGKSVMTTYNGKTYRIDGVDWEKCPTDTFTWNRNGESTELSFKEYLSRQYDVTIHDETQPLIFHEPRSSRNRVKRLYFIPEACKLQVNVLDADYKIRRDLGVMAHAPPSIRIEAGKSLVNPNKEFSKSLETWHGKVASEPIETTGTQLPKCNIESGGKRLNTRNRASWLSQINRAKCHAPAKIQKWMVLYPRSVFSGDTLEKFLAEMQKIADDMGFKLPLPQRKGYASAKDISKLPLPAKENTFVLVVSRNKNKRFYQECKKKFCQKGVLSQMLLKKNVFNYKRRHAILQNLIRQVQSKLGGQLWNLHSSYLASGTYIVGVDIWHGLSGRDQSCVGIAVSADHGKSYRTETLWQTRISEEVVQNLLGHILKIIKTLEKDSNIRCNKILIFRDGVGNSQITEVIQKEINVINVKGTKIPPIAMIMVNKRGNRRIFRNSSIGYDNVPPGTIAPGIGQDPRYPNFYMAAHTSRLGALSPAHLTVLYNETDYAPETLIEIGYELCHLYDNYPGAIKIPAPIEYAHKAAYLNGTSQIAEIHDRLKRHKYYI